MVREGGSKTGKESKAEIYRKALDLFVGKRYDGTFMSMVAKILGMSKANLYYYCFDIEDLLYRVHLHALQENFIPM
jgi:AcrR family transcriptional regulator